MKNTIVIKENRVFKYVLKKGTYLKGNYLNIHVLDKSNKLKTNQFGVCVSKKNGNSVQRNKLKRWIREIYKIEENKLKKGITLIILVKKNTNFEDVDFHKLQNDLINLFERLNIYEI